MSLLSSSPSSQKADSCPIAFALYDLNNSQTPKTVQLYVRPEDLTRTDQSRVAVQQTFGGGFADNFGKGIPRINISGNTGWAVDVNGADGVQRFIDLKTQIYDAWHQAKSQAYSGGKNPDLVQLMFIDALNQYTASVIPGEIVLRRSRSRPLLLQYQIAMTVMGDVSGAYTTVSSSASSDTSSSALASILQSLANLTRFMTSVSSWISSTIIAPIKSFIATATKVFTAVTTAIRSVVGVAQSVMNVAKTIAQAGVTLVRTAMAIVTMPQTIKAAFMGIASSFTNIFCVLKNAVNQSKVYQDYSAIYGSSNCSSTNGGRTISSYANSSALAAVAPMPTASPVTVTQSGQSSLTAMATTDPVLAPMNASTFTTHLANINSGVTVTG